MAKVILFRGRAGTGKTRISNEIGKRLKLPILRKDDIYDTVSDFIAEHDARNRFCYRLIYQMMKTNLNCGADLIVDAPFPNIIELGRWIKDNNGIFLPILCTCRSEEIWAHRFNQRRRNPRPNNIITDFAEMKKHYGGELFLQPVDGELVLDSVYEIEVLVKQVRRV
jgi:predicted kinase